MIDILTYTQKRTVNKIRTIRVVMVFLWGIILLLAIAVILFLPTLHTINSRFVLADAQMRRLEAGGLIAKKADISELKNKTNHIIEKIAADLPPSPLEYINLIQKHEVDGIKLTGFSINGIVVEVNGVASTRQNLQRFVNELQAEPSITTVNSPVTNFIKNNQNEFSISLTFKSV